MQNQISLWKEELNCHMQKADEEFFELYRLLAENRGEGQKVHEEVQSLKEILPHWEGELKNTQALADSALSVSSQCQNFITKELPQRMGQFQKQLEPKLVKQEDARASVNRNNDDCPWRSTLQASNASAGLASSSCSSRQSSRCSSTSDVTGLITSENFPRPMTCSLKRALAVKDKALPTSLGYRKEIAL